MHTWNSLESLPEPLAASSVAIGTFDGVHRGHQALIRLAMEDARAHSRASVVFTFDRHPLEIVAPERVPGYLTTLAQRSERIRALGPDHLVVAHFDARLRDMAPETFLQDVLHDRLGARSITVGEGFRFGRNQAGDTALLRAAQARLGFELRTLEPVAVAGERVSSSRIRQMLRAGDVAGAETMLGRLHALTGTVVEGEKLGRQLGFPTANLEPEIPMVVPADGIYAVWVEWKGRRWKGACSIGMRPTVGGTRRTIETFLLDFSGDLYGETLSIAFAVRLREERKFDSLDALVAQMVRDVEQAAKALREQGTGNRE